MSGIAASRPWRSLRARLAMLYIVPFVVSGAVLVTVLLRQIDSTVAAPVGTPGNPDSADPPAIDFGPVVTASVLGLAAMALLAVVLGWLIAGRFLRPLRAITATAHEISATNLHRRLGPTGHGDEFTDLATTLDDLFERLQASFDSQRHFVANASHELRTPLTAERTLLQVALADPDASIETLRSACEEVLTLGVAQERLINALLVLATSEQGIERREPFDLGHLTRTIVDARRQDAQNRGIDVNTNLATAPAAGDPRLIESLVTNLVDNAIRHNTSGGRVDVITATTDGRASITVGNTGPILQPDDVGEAFQPFRRVGQERVLHSNGHGLGLAIVHAIAQAHDATLTANARPEGGLDVEFRFPRKYPGNGGNGPERTFGDHREQ